MGFGAKVARVDRALHKSSGAGGINRLENRGGGGGDFFRLIFMLAMLLWEDALGMGERGGKALLKLEEGHADIVWLKRVGDSDTLFVRGEEISNIFKLEIWEKS